ncbi:Aste57867_14228 [Aphanomyces stellatus]|uniref:Aste57867_14228 protein n=1 Tax=Aphanomyces stellatus TaxID=120398 RepID=A0A485L0P9_9STRA|nr:hypothetical protein As57867_014177 [Aphanomyces stellatus]VFT91053.1 Aste57867_14228 [Aphanomyces stellatus]
MADPALADVMDADALKKMELKLKKREYIRNMMRIYRQQDREGLMYLRNRVKELEGELTTLSHKQKPPPTAESHMLSWKEIAVALREERHRSEMEHEQLKLEVAEKHALLEEMKQWTVSRRSILPSLNANTRTWRNSSLFAQPRSRALGKAWITEQMYHNADRMFHDHGFPALDREFETVDIHFTDGGVFDLVHRRQGLVTVPPKALMALYRQHLCDIITVDWFQPVVQDTLAEETTQTSLHQLNIDGARQEYVNVLAGEFHDATASLFVAQQITDDESVQHNRLQRNRMIWMQLVPTTTPGQLVLRFLYVKSQLFTHGSGYVPLQKEADVWGIDLDARPPQVSPEMHFRRRGLDIVYGGLLRMAHARLANYFNQLVLD